VWLYHKIETKDLGYHGILDHFQKGGRGEAVTNMTPGQVPCNVPSMDNTNQNSIALQVPHLYSPMCLLGMSSLDVCFNASIVSYQTWASHCYAPILMIN